MNQGGTPAAREGADHGARRGADDELGAAGIPAGLLGERVQAAGEPGAAEHAAGARARGRPSRGDLDARHGHRITRKRGLHAQVHAVSSLNGAGRIACGPRRARGRKSGTPMVSTPPARSAPARRRLPRRAARASARSAPAVQASATGAAAGRAGRGRRSRGPLRPRPRPTRSPRADGAGRITRRGTPSGLRHSLTMSSVVRRTAWTPAASAGARARSASGGSRGRRSRRGPATPDHAAAGLRRRIRPAIAGGAGPRAPAGGAPGPAPRRVPHAARRSAVPRGARDPLRHRLPQLPPGLALGRLAPRPPTSAASTSATPSTRPIHSTVACPLCPAPTAHRRRPYEPPAHPWARAERQVRAPDANKRGVLP